MSGLSADGGCEQYIVLSNNMPTTPPWTMNESYHERDTASKHQNPFTALNMQHQYYDRDLDASRQDIRLIDLKPGFYDDIVDISIRTVSLAENPRFNALSYVWGDAAQQVPIRLGGIEISVTKNLEVALRHLRYHQGRSVEDMPLWVDAICINQANIDERNHEVKRMKDIYGRASRVLIWLGEGDVCSDELFDRIGDMEFHAGLRELQVTPHRAKTRDELRAYFIFNSNIDARPWWGRIWVLQELVVATEDPIVLCGEKSTTWSGLIGFQALLNKVSGDDDIGQYTKSESLRKEVWDQLPRFNFGGGSHPYHLSWAKIRRLYHEHGALPLHEAVLATKRAKATDKHDFIYGQLGLMSSNDAASLTVDYGKHPMSVFMEVIKNVWTSQDIEPLSEVIPLLLYVPSQGLPAFPSWVPDLATDFDYHEFTASRLYSHSARCIWRSSKDASISISPSSNGLTLKGVKIDVIRSVTEEKLDLFPIIDTLSLKIIEKQWLEGETQQSSQTDFLARLHSTKPQESLVSFVSGLTGGQIDLIVKDAHNLWETWLGRTPVSSDSHKKTGLESSNSSFHSLYQEWEEASKTSRHPLLENIFHRLRSRRIFTTKYGFVGIGTPSIKARDIVTRPYGSNCQYILRPREHPKPGYVLVGFAYLSGFTTAVDMDYYCGEGALSEETFEIY